MSLLRATRDPARMVNTVSVLGDARLYASGHHAVGRSNSATIGDREPDEVSVAPQRLCLAYGCCLGPSEVR